MDSRKIIKFGTSSYVVTLPNVWLKENNLKKGDEINLCNSKNLLVFSLKKENEERVAKINLENKPLKLFNRELISYYLKNFKIIEIIGTNLLDKIEQIKVFKEKLSSVEIVEISNEKIILKDLTSPQELDLLRIVSDLINMEKMLFSNLIKINLDHNIKIKKYSILTQLDSNINKLSFLAFKAINYNLDHIFDPEQVKDSIHYWRIVSSFEHIGDIIKRIARYLRNDNSEVISHFTKLFQDVSQYFDFIAKFLTKEIKLENNLKIHLDKKQSLLREFELIRTSMKSNLNLYLVLTQLLKDILGQLDIVVLSIIDLDHK